MFAFRMSPGSRLDKTSVAHSNLHTTLKDKKVLDECGTIEISHFSLQFILSKGTGPLIHDFACNLVWFIRPNDSRMATAKWILAICQNYQDEVH